MRPASIVTKVGSTAAGRESRSEVLIFSEPEVGATLRTRGRLYLLCEVDPPSKAGMEIAQEASDLVRQEYYYDLSAGIEVALRRALRKANRRAAQQLRDHRGRIALHCACAVIVNNEVYAARVGSAHVFLVRHARLFLPGDEPDELADFVHRTTTRQAVSLGSEPDLLPPVWRQALDVGDTIILASGGVVDALGAEALKNAAVTLHPRAAADHVRNLFVAEGAGGSAATVFIEIAVSTGAAARVQPQPEPIAEPEEVELAESIRARVDRLWRRRPRVERLLAAVVSPLAGALRRLLGVGIELMPRRSAGLPRRPQSARVRIARTQRITTLLALLLLVVSLGIAGLAIRDFQASQVFGDYRIAIVGIETEIASAQSFASRNDDDRAWARLEDADQRLERVAASPVAQEEEIARLRAQIGMVADQLNNVIVDVAAVAPASRLVDLIQLLHGLYAADAGAAHVWLVQGEPAEAEAVLDTTASGIGLPVHMVARDEGFLLLDEARRLWLAVPGELSEVVLPGAESWGETTDLATFVGNIYILDSANGQLWRYEDPADGEYGDPIPFLPEALPAGSARAVAVDGDIWIITAEGEIQRYRRQGIDVTLTRLPFEPRWLGEPPRATAIQAIDLQAFVWLLDAPARQVIQLTRDAREIARFALPERLPEPSAFFVSEGQSIVYSVHGSEIAATDITR